MTQSQSRFHGLVGRALTDPEYRERLLDPEQRSEAMQEANVDPTEETLEAIQNAIDAITNLTAQIGGPPTAA